VIEQLTMRWLRVAGSSYGSGSTRISPWPDGGSRMWSGSLGP